MTAREDAIKAVELELMDSPTRQDHRRLLSLLHEDFVEIGRSGRRWTRDEIIESLRAEQDRSPTHVDEWAFMALTGDLTLVTYRVNGSFGVSRHASIWDSSSNPPRIRFHQGTIVVDASGRRGHDAT